MEEKIKDFVELLNTSAKFGKYFFVFDMFKYPLSSFKEGGDPTRIEGMYEAQCWYEDYRDIKKNRINCVRNNWRGVLTEDSKEEFLKWFLISLFKATLYIRTSENIEDLRGNIIMCKTTSELLENGYSPE